MRKAKKRTAVVRAFRLGDESKIAAELMAEGKIKALGGGSFEVFSQEARDGAGETAHAGDYIMVDSSGNPYPNSAEYFEENHRHLAAEYYEQRPYVADIWTYGEPVCAEIRYLLDHKQLTFHEEEPERYFQAPLWGTKLSAARDAVIVFYRIVRDGAGRITDADFNFVAGDEFKKTYDILETDKERQI